MSQTAPEQLEATQDADGDTRPVRGPVDICSELLVLGKAKLQPSEYYRETLSRIIEHFESPCGAISIQTTQGAFDDYIASGDDDSWRPIMDEMLLDSQVEFKPIAPSIHIQRRRVTGCRGCGAN